MGGGRRRATGRAPPRPRRGGQRLPRDEHGIATGGLRSPWVDVPAATLSGLGQTGEVFSILFGTTTPFDASTLAALYPGGRDDYLARFTDALDEIIAAGFVLDGRPRRDPRGGGRVLPGG